MNERQAQIAQYVRALSLRDNVGPDSFQIQERSPVEDQAAISNTEETMAAEDASSDDGTDDSAVVESLNATADRASRLRRTRRHRTQVPGKVAAGAAPITQAEQLTLTPEAAAAYARALSGKPLSAQDSLHLEAIVLPALRPAFDIVDETYDTLPAMWNVWNLKKASVNTILRGVGRLQLTGHPSYTLVGTGFVCGPNTILTNRHVAQIFVQGIGSGAALTYTPGVTCAMNMLAEVGSSATLLLNLDQPIMVSEAWDVAVLHCQSLPASVTPLPLASVAPPDLNGGDVAIIGYPSYDPFESLADQANIFRSVFDRKRLQPGKVNGRANVPSFGKSVSAIMHDCSTLGGNSGSALLSADTMEVIGIHFSGSTHISNYAVPVWELVRETALLGQSLNFQ